MSEVGISAWMSIPALISVLGTIVAGLGCQAFGVLKFFSYANLLWVAPMVLGSMVCVWTSWKWLFLSASLIGPIAFSLTTIPCYVLFMQPLEKAYASAEAIATISTMTIGPLIVGIPSTLAGEQSNRVRTYCSVGVAADLGSMLIIWLGFLLFPPKYALEGQRRFDASLAKGAAGKEATAAAARPSEGEETPAATLIAA
mmetsp:Transcript_78454/g.208322  ORF Transcript_78454/g.208322 Transcript_78454/m.208322 type:complete len:199 (-) Transcript_78454:40-636(-)